MIVLDKIANQAAAAQLQLFVEGSGISEYWNGSACRRLTRF